MALVKGTPTTGAPAGGSTSYTLTNAVTVASGTNRFLMFVVAHDPSGAGGTATISSVTFNGTAMTKKTTLNASGFYETSWGLVNADAGTHNIVVTFNRQIYYGWRWLACGFTGCDGFGNTTANGYSNSPHSRSITVSEGSAMYTGGAGTYEASKITIDGTETLVGSCNLRGSVYTKNWVGHISPVGLSSGSRTGIVTGALTSYTFTNTTLEIKEAASAVAPTVTTDSIDGIRRRDADGGGNVTSDGGATITARGVCWNTTGTPTTSDSKTTESGTTGTFTSDITGLSPGTLYYVRAYATNSAGTSYGSQESFTTNRIINVF